MNLTINRDSALAAVAFARSAVERRNTIPILGSVRMRATEGAVEFTGTDLDLEAARSSDASVTEPGDLALNADRLMGALQSLPSGADISFAQDASRHRVVVQSGRARFQIPYEDGSDFPSFDFTPETEAAELDASDVERLIEATEFAVARDMSRPYITGLHLCVVDETLRAVATNGAVMSLAEAARPDGMIGKGQTLPLKTIGLLRDMAKGAEAVTVRQSAALFFAAAGRSRMASKVIDQAFPDYLRVIPKDPPHTCRFPREPFARALSRCLSASDYKLVGATLAILGGEMTLSTRGEHGEEAEDAFEVEADAEFSAPFNARYLLDIANRFSCEDLILRYSDNASPVTISPPDDPASMAVIIALRA